MAYWILLILHFSRTTWYLCNLCMYDWNPSVYEDSGPSLKLFASVSITWGSKTRLLLCPEVDERLLDVKQFLEFSDRAGWSSSLPCLKYFYHFSPEVVCIQLKVENSQIKIRCKQLVCPLPDGKNVLRLFAQLIIDGVGFPSVGSIVGVDNADVAKAAKAPVLLVCNLP